MKDTNRKPLNYNEIKVRFIYEQIFRTKLIDGDRPDIYASDNSLDIEATSAGGINCKIFKRVDGEIVTENLNYNHLEGKNYKCMRETGIINPELCFASAETNPDIYKFDHQCIVGNIKKA